MLDSQAREPGGPPHRAHPIGACGGCCTSKGTFGRQVSDVTFLKHLPFRDAQRMLWLKFTRLENLRNLKDLWQSKWREESKKVQDTHISFVAIIRVRSTFQKIKIIGWNVVQKPESLWWHRLCTRHVISSMIRHLWGQHRSYCCLSVTGSDHMKVCQIAIDKYHWETPWMCCVPHLLTYELESCASTTPQSQKDC